MESAELEIVICQQYIKLYKYALSILRRPCDAEDAVQSACLKAWINHRHTAVRICTAWLKTIVYRECMTILRARAKQALYIDSAYDGNFCLSNETLNTFMDTLCIQAAIQELPYRYSSLIVLHYYCGREINDIAKELSVPAGTIRSRLSRGRKMIRAYYSNSTMVIN